MERPLQGLRVLDLSQFLSGPRCTQLLAQAGAEVIKIEPPSGETMRLLTMVTGTERMMSLINADKKCVVLDLKKEEAKDLFRQLVRVSDVVVENFAPGAMERMGLDYARLCKENPKLIYATISGFGKTGPFQDRLAFDIIAQATGGIMAAYDLPDRPPAVFFADLVSGAYCANGILLALFQRERTGKGQLVDVSMQDVMYFHHFSAQCHRALEAVQEDIRGIMGKPLDKLFSDPDNPVPFWYSYRARNGHVVIVALTDGQWNRLMETIGRGDLVGDERFDSIVTRVRNAREGLDTVSPWMAERTVEDIVDALHKARVPCGPVLDKAEVNLHEQLRAREMLLERSHPRLGTIPVPGCPVKLSESPCEVSTPCPDVGTHTEEVLKSLLKLSDEEVAGIRERGLI